MLTGADIRRFRKSLELTQEAFALKLGLSQPTLSLLEAGKVGLDEKYLDTLTRVFAKAGFAAFAETVKKERSTGQPLIGHPQAHFAVIPVWRWEHNFDLAATLSGLAPCSYVMVQAPSNEVIAFQMPRATTWWKSDEILVFRRIESDACQNGDLLLLQVKPPRARVPQTMLVAARYAPHGAQRILQCEPTEAGQPLFTPEADQIQAMLRCIFRARYLDE